MTTALRRRPRLMRTNYDKAHRRPAWSGPAMKAGPQYDSCPSGRIVIDYDDRLWRWKTHRCTSCDVIVLPDVIRNLDPAWWRWALHRRWSDFTYRLSLRWSR